MYFFFCKLNVCIFERLFRDLDPGPLVGGGVLHGDWDQLPIFLDFDETGLVLLDIIKIYKTI